MSQRLTAQQERALGTFALVVDSAPGSEASWRALRRALRVSRADEQWLKGRVPGVVRRGAEVDLQPVAEVVREAGFQARVVRTQKGAE